MLWNRILNFVRYYFKSKDRGVVDVEDSTLCFAYCDLETLAANRRTINQIANSLAIEFEQESLAVVVDKRMYFFGPNDVYKKRYEQLVQKWEANPKLKKIGWRRFVEIDL